MSHAIGESYRALIEARSPKISKSQILSMQNLISEVGTIMEVAYTTIRPQNSAITFNKILNNFYNNKLEDLFENEGIADANLIYSTDLQVEILNLVEGYSELEKTIWNKFHSLYPDSPVKICQNYTPTYDEFCTQETMDYINSLINGFDFFNL